MNLVILILATWRLSSLLASEPGPWDVFGRLRHLAGVSYDDIGQPYGANVLARGLMCVWCNSLWVGLGWAALHYAAPGVAFWLALPFALSTGAILINEISD